jgi:hypothetical protein
VRGHVAGVVEVAFQPVGSHQVLKLAEPATVTAPSHGSLGVAVTP